MKKLVYARSLYVFIAVALIGFALFSLSQIFSNPIPEGIEINAVARGDVVEIVSETGVVTPAKEVALALLEGGRIQTISRHAGDHVEEGAELIVLDAAAKNAELASAHARVEAERVRLDELLRGADTLSLGVTESSVESAEVAYANAKANLEKVTSQQDQLVENAHRLLLTSGLAAHFIGKEHANSSYSHTAPTITGTYEGAEEGVYLVDPYSSNAASGGSFRVSGMETDSQSVSTVKPQPLGTRGLYIQFPDDFARYADVLWEVQIPNTRSSTYPTYLNAYNAALGVREVAVRSAENTLKSAEAALAEGEQQLIQVSSSARTERIAAQEAVVRQMEAAAESARIALDHMTLRAPFSGIITNIGVEVGEIIAASVPALTFISDEVFELTVNISESDIHEISVDDTAIVTFDAYDAAAFAATVREIAPVATPVDGVRVFEVTLQFEDKDQRIRSGLSADIDILSAKRENVLAVPSRAVLEREDGTFVRALRNGGIEYLPVEVGLRGSNGVTEILAGLTEGQEIITFGDEDALQALESN